MFDPITGIMSILTGIGGSIVTSVVNYKMKKLDIELQKEKFKHEENMIDKQTEAMIKEAEANIKVTQTITEGQIELAETKAFSDSIKQQTQTLFQKDYMQFLFNSNSKFLQWLGGIIMIFFAFIDMVKASIRPGIAIYLGGIATYFTLKAYEICGSLQNAFPPDKAAQLLLLIVTTLLQMLLVAWGWYFADRRISKDFAKRLIDKKII